MIIITTALYCEAKALIEKFGLKKDTSNTRFQVFMDREKEMLLVITGVGSIAAAAAVSGVCARYEDTQGALSGYKSGTADFLVNIGTCSGQQAEGTIYICNKITELATGRTFYPDMLYRHPFRETQITTVMKVLKSGELPCCGKDALFDMEAAAVYQAGAYFFGPHQMSFIKVISDNASPSSVTEKKLEALIEKNIDRIAEYIDTLKKASVELHNKDILDTDGNREWVDMLCSDMHCSATMKAAVEQHIRYSILEERYESLNGGSRDIAQKDAQPAEKRKLKPHCREIAEKMYTEKILPCADKREGKRCFEELKRQLS